MKNEMVFETLQFYVHFHLLCLSYYFLVIRWLLTSRFFLLFLFESILAGSWKFTIHTISLHVSHGWTSLKFELISPSLSRHHWLCVSGKLVGQMPLLKNTDTIFFFLVKITSPHVSGVIANAFIPKHSVYDLSITKLSIVCLSIVLNGLNTVTFKFWIKWLSLSWNKTNMI